MERKKIMKKLYFRELGQWIELNDEVADALESDRTRVRVTELYNGRCRIAKSKTYLCDGNCFDCIYHHEGRKVVKKNTCDHCPCGVVKARRGRAEECRHCENYEFLANVSLSEDAAIPRNVEKVMGTAPSPEEIFLEKEAIDEYKALTKSIPGGDELIDRLSSGDKVSEIVNDTGKPRSTVRIRKDRVKKAIETQVTHGKKQGTREKQ